MKHWKRNLGLICLTAALALVLCAFGAAAEQPMPALTAPVITVDPVIQAGQDVTISFSGLDQGVRGWYFWVEDRFTDGSYDHIIQASSQDGQSVLQESYTYSADMFQAGHAYHVYAYTSNTLDEGIGNETDFVVLGETDTNLSIALNGDGNEQVSMLVNDYGTLTLSAPGCTGLTLFMNGQWARCWNFNQSTGTAELSVYFSTPGSRVLVARASYDSSDSYAYSDQISNVIVADVISYGPAETPAIQTAKTAYSQGEVIAFKVQGQETDTRFRVRYGFDDRSSSNDTLTVKNGTASVFIGNDQENAASCTVTVQACAPGYEWSAASEPTVFTITEAPDQVNFYIDHTDVLVNQYYAWSAFAPGSTAIHICDGSRDNVIDDYNGFNYSCRRIERNVQQHDFFAVADFMDDNGDIYQVESRHIPIAITSLGTLETVSIAGPSRVQPGEDVTLTFSGLNGVTESWNYEIVANSGEYFSDYEYSSNTNAAGDGDYIIPGEKLQRNGGYISVNLTAYSEGYDTLRLYKPVFVVEGEDTVGVTVNGLDISTLETDVLEVPVNQPLDLVFSAPGAVELQYFDDYGGNYWHSVYDFNSQTGTGRLSREYAEGSHILAVRARYSWNGSDNWQALSRVITIKTVAYGQAGKAEVETDKTEFAWGELIPVTVKAADNADRYRVYHQYYWDSGESYIVDTEYKNITGDFNAFVSPPCDELNAAYCRIWVETCGVGYTWNTTQDEPLVLTITPYQGGVVFFVTDNEVLANQRYGWSVSAPEAAQLCVYDGDRDHVIDSTGGTWQYNIAWSNETAGVHEYFAVAEYYDGQGQLYEVESPHVTVTVTSAGPLEGVAIEAPQRVQPGQDVTIHVTGLEKATSAWDYQIYRENDYGYRAYQGSRDNGTDTLVIPGEEVTEGSYFSVYLTALAEGYDALHERKIIFTVEGEDVLSLTINGADAATLPQNTAEILINQDVYFIVTAPGAVEVQYFDGNNWDYAYEYDEPGIWRATKNYSEYGVGRHIYAFRARYDSSSYDNWQALSPVVTLNVTQLGQAGKSAIEAERTEFVRGEPMIFTVKAAENADRYSVCYRFEWEGGSTGSYGGTYTNVTGDFVAMLPTTEAEEATACKVWIETSGVGYGWNTTEDEPITFTITEPEEQIGLFVTETDVEVYQPFGLSVYAPGANYLWIYDGSSNNTVSETGENQYFNPSISLQRSGEHDLYAVAEFFGDDGLPYEVESRHITVNAASAGPLEGIAIEAPLRVQAGEDVTIHVTGLESAARSWNFQVTRSSDYGYSASRYSTDSDPSDTIVIPAEEVPAGATFIVTLSATAQGYDRLDLKKAVFAMSGDDTVGLAVNGVDVDTLPSDVLEVLVNKRLYYSISAPGAVQVQYMSPYGDWYNIWNFDPSTGRGSMEDEFTLPNSLLVVFRARYDESDPNSWQALSRPITVNAVAYGQAGKASVEAEKTEFSRGEPITFTIKAAENADRYEVHYQFGDDEDDYGYVNRTYTNVTGDLLVQIPTHNYEEATWCEVWIASKGEGYLQNTTGEENPFRFTIVEPTAQVALYMQETDLLINQQTEIYAYAPGASRVSICDGTPDNWMEYNFNYHTEFHGTIEKAGTHDIFAIAQFYDDEGVLTTVESEHITVTVTSYGPLEGVILTVPKTVREGEDVEVLFTGMDTFEGPWHFQFSRSIDWDVRENFDTSENWTSYVIPSREMEGGYAFTVTVDIRAVGYDSLRLDEHVFVLGETDDNVLLTINGDADPERLLINTDYTLQVSAPGATAVAVLYGTQWHYADTTGTDGVCSFEYNANRASSDVFTAKACYEPLDYENLDWEELNWQGTGNVINVPFISLGKAPLPEITFPESRNFVRGQIVPLQIEASETLERLELWIYSVDPLHAVDSYPYNSDGQGIPADIGLPTAALPAGDYILRVSVSAPGYEADATDLYDENFLFTVSEPSEGISFSVSQTELETCERYSASAYAPGADVIYIHLNSTDNWLMYSYSEYTMAFRTYFSGSGTYELFAVAHYWNDDGSETLVESEHVTMTVTSKGPMHGVGMSVPAMVKVGEDCLLQFTGLDTVEEWDVDVYRMDPWSYIDSFNSYEYGAAESCAISANDLTLGSIYRVTLRARSIGYDTLVDEHFFFVYDAEQEAQIHLSINGSEEDTVSTLLYVPAEITVEAPGAATVEAFINGYWDALNYDEAGNVWRRDVSLGKGSHAMVARAFYDGPDASAAYSNIVTLDVICYGLADLPEVAYERTEYTRGEIIPVTITPSEHANRYSIAYQFEGIGWFSRQYYDNQTDTFTAYVPTISGNSDKPASVSIWATAEGPGYERNETGRQVITISEPTEPVSIFISSTELTANEDCTISTYAPGADMTVLHLLKNGQQYRQESYPTDYRFDRYAFDSAGEYEVYAVAWYPDGEGGQYTVESQHISVTVTSLGALDNPDVTVPWKVPLGQDVTIRFAGLEKYTKSWYISIHDDESGREVAYLSSENTIGTLESYVISASKLQAGHFYAVSVNGWALGYDMTDGVTRVFVVYDGESAHSIDLTADGSSGETVSCLINETIVLTVSAPGALEIQYTDGPGGWSWCRDFDADEGTGSIYCNYNEAGQYTLAARARYTKNGPWEAVSDMITLNVVSYGPASAPEVSLDRTEYVRGEPIFLTVTPTGETSAYRIGYQFEGVEWSGWRRYTSEGTFQAFIPSVEDECNEAPAVTVWAEAGGPGYEWASSEKLTVTLTDPTEPLSFYVSNTEPLVNERIFYSIYAPGAQRVALHRVEPEGGEYVYQSTWSTALYENIGFGVHGTYGLYATALFENENGELVEVESEHISLTVTALGKVENVEVTAPMILPYGEDLTFQVSNMEQFTEDWYIEVYDRTDEREILWMHKNSGDSLRPSYTVPAANLKKNHVYNIWIHGEKTGYEFDSLNVGVFVAGEESSQNLHLTANGSDAQNIDLLINENLNLTVLSPYGCDVLYFCNGWWNWFDEEADGGWQSNFTFSEPGRQLILACIRNDETGAWEDISNPICVNVIKYGDTGSAEAVFDRTEFTRGEPIRFTLKPAENAAFYQVDYTFENDDGWYSRRFYGEGDIVASIPSVENSDDSTWCKIRVRAGAPGYSWSDSGWIYTVTLTDPEEDVSFYVNATEIICGDPLEFTAYAPGARRVSLYGAPNTWYQGFWMSHCTSEHTFDHGGTYELFIRAEYIREDGSSYIKESRHVEVNILSEGQIEGVDVTVPALVPAGEDLVIQTQNLDTANASWWMYLRDNRTREVEWQLDSHDYEFEQEGVITVPARYLIPGHDYKVTFGARVYGYDTLYLENFVLVGNNEVQTGVLLTVNGSDDQVSALIYDHISVTVNAPGATAAAVWANGGWTYMWPKNGVFTDILTMDNSKTPVTFIAKVCYDPLPSGYYDWKELNWTAISNIVTVTPQCLGSVELPALTVTESAVRGEFLPVTVSGGLVDAEYQLVIRNANNEWIDSYYVYRDDPDQEETVMLSTARLTPGVSYHISVDANPIPGYESAADSGKANAFTVSAPEEGLHVHYTATEVPFTQTVRAAGVAPGADSISVRVEVMGEDGLETVDDWAENMDNMTVWLDYSTWKEPTLYVTFSARYGEEWKKSETTQVSFLAEGALEKPAFTVSKAVTDFSDIRITVGEVEHAKNYYLDICRLFIYEDGEIDYEYADFAAVKPGTFTLTADMLEDGGEYLVPGWVYAFVLNVYGDGYYPSFSDVRTAPRVIVTEPGTLMRLPAALKAIEPETFVGSTARAVVIPEGVTSIGSRAFADCKSLFAVVIPDSVTEIAEDAFEGCPEDVIFIGNSPNSGERFRTPKGGWQ